MASFNSSGATGHVFNLKKITKKLFLITHGTLKPVKFTATSSDVIIEDDILCDGDNCYQLIIEDGTIKIDSINEIENVSSEAKTVNRMGNNFKTTVRDNDEHDVGSDFVKDIGDIDLAVGSDCLDDVENDKTAEGFSNDSSPGTCVICMETMTEPKTIQCGHTFCTDCIDQQFEYKKQCPTCFQVCGTITGDQPFGTIDVRTDKYRHLTGYESYDTIMITYKFPDGYQKDNHPSPGHHYKGITRTAYLPANDEGRKIAKMLKLAFDRKLTFTIGNSRTTGQQGVITWNNIHHKTDPRPNSQFGYPDPTYFDRVKDELAAKGITEADIENDKTVC